MKYIFLEKHGSNSDPLYKEYLYFIIQMKELNIDIACEYLSMAS